MPRLFAAGRTLHRPYERPRIQTNFLRLSLTARLVERGFSRRENQDDAERADQGHGRLHVARDGSGCPPRWKVAWISRAPLRRLEFHELGLKAHSRLSDDHH